MTARIGVGPDDAGVIPAIVELAVPGGVLILGPGANATAGLAAWLETGPVGFALSPALAGANAHGSLIQIIECGSEFLSIAHLLHELVQFFGRAGEGLCGVGLVTRLELFGSIFQMIGHLAVIAGGINRFGNIREQFLQFLGGKIRRV